MGGGGPEGTERAPAGSGDANAGDDFDDASRRGGQGDSELARLLEDTIFAAAVALSELVVPMGLIDDIFSIHALESEREKEKGSGEGERAKSRGLMAKKEVKNFGRK